MTMTRKTIVKDLILLMISISIMMSILLGSRQLTTPDEGRYAEIPRQMLLHHDYVTPRINGIKYFEKPPLFYWMQAANIKLFGLNEWSVRIATALMGIFGCLMTYLTAAYLFDRRTALLAAVVLASSGLYFGLSRFVTLDMTVAVFISATLFCFMLFEHTKQTKFIYGMYAFSALATLTKGFIGFILPGSIIFCWILVTNNWLKLKYYRLVSGTLLFLLIALPWHIIAQIRNPEFLQYYVLDQQILRYFTDIAGRDKPLWFLPGILIMGLLPWTPWLLQAIKTAWRQFRFEKNAELLMLLIWPTVTFLFFWFSKSQLSPYILPMFPAIALLIGNHFNQVIILNKSQWKYFFILWGVVAVISTAALIHFSAADKTVFINVVVLISTLILTSIVYGKRNFQAAIFTLALGFSVFMISLNLSVPKHDTRSVKPLTSVIKSMMKPDDMIASYNYLYQDMSVYLNHDVTLVNYYGELKYGIQHQDTKDVWISADKFWKLWRSHKKRILLIMNNNDYVHYVGRKDYKMHLIAKTENAVLISNFAS